MSIERGAMEIEARNRCDKSTRRIAGWEAGIQALRKGGTQLALRTIVHLQGRRGLNGGVVDSRRGSGLRRRRRILAFLLQLHPVRCDFGLGSGLSLRCRLSLRLRLNCLLL